MGKFVKTTFNEKENRALVILERVHIEVCGPFSVASTAKHRYYVISFYDYSPRCWILFMQKKNETFSKFCEFKSLVEKESGKQVKALQSNIGGEYISNEFKDYCNKDGIRRELTVPHNSQQNGIAKRNNRTIIGVARAMFERELDLHAEEGLPVLKDEPPDVDRPQEEVHGVEESTYAEPNIRQGRKCTT